MPRNGTRTSAPLPHSVIRINRSTLTFYQADCLDVRHGSGVELHWLPRDLLNCEHGQAMLHAGNESAKRPGDYFRLASAAGRALLRRR